MTTIDRSDKIMLLFGVVVMLIGIAGFVVKNHEVIQLQARVVQLKFMAACTPSSPDQIASIALRDGRAECSITGGRGGRRALLDRRTL